MPWSGRGGSARSRSPIRWRSVKSPPSIEATSATLTSRSATLATGCTQTTTALALWRAGGTLAGRVSSAPAATAADKQTAAAQGRCRDRALIGGYLVMSLAVDSISSPTRIARELISYARWAMIRLTSSDTTSTFERSKKPCRSVPKPFWPGVPVVGEPEAADSAYRLPPSLDKPAGFAKRTSVRLPTVVELFGEPAVITEIVPSVPMEIDRTSWGSVTCGWIRYPSEVTTFPVEFRRR